MMVAARTSETSVDNYFTRQYIPEDKSELRTLLFKATLLLFTDSAQYNYSVALSFKRTVIKIFCV
jgi:hypothetical protein